jgi:iron complex outermembrane receptor protein
MTDVQGRRRRRGAALVAVTWAIGCAVGRDAHAAGADLRFQITAGPLDVALLAYAAQSGDQLLYSAEQVSGRRAQGLAGVMTASAALSRLLAGTDLVAQPSGPHVLVLKLRPRLSGADVAALGAPEAGGPKATVRRAMRRTDGGKEGATPLDELVVTGTLIHGARALLSPVLQFDLEALGRLGSGTAADALSRLPQAFSGQATVNTAVLLADPVATNDTMASGVSLRGLGAPSTLVLVNGGRLAGAGTRGDFADVSQIPTVAISRVDVLLDGASALYGSDAVGGVINIMLRRPFDGAESRLRLSVPTQGGGATVQVGEMLGRTWPGGGVLLAYEHEHQDELSGEDREATRTSDLRPLGGADHRVVFAHPGNLVRFDVSTGTYQPIYAIPAGQSGVGLTPADLLAGQINLDNNRAEASLFPRQDRDSVYLRLDQSMTAKLAVSADLRYSRRAFTLARPAALAVLAVGPANPYFVTPDGADIVWIGYSFSDEIGPMRTQGSSESLGATVGARLDLAGDWRFELKAGHATETGRRRVIHQLNTRFLSEALGNIPDDPATPYVAARDGYFNAFGDTGANSPRVLTFVSSGYTRAVSASAVDTLDLKVDGSLGRLPGGPFKVAVGVQVRQERFESGAESLLTRAVPRFSAFGPFGRQIEAAFLEVRAPLAPSDGATPLGRLELSLAGRLEGYDDVGRTANPRVGLLWAPAHHLSLRATYGTSFRAPNLTELHGVQTISSTLLPSPAGQTAVIVLSGGNRDLRPEHAKSWTIGFDLAPENLSGLQLSATWFSTTVTGEIGAPVLGDNINALIDPAYTLLVRRVSPADPVDLAYVNALIAQPGASVALPATSVAAVVDARSVNAGRIEVEGVDVSAAYGLVHSPGQWDFAAQATYLRRFTRQPTPMGAVADLVNTVGQPLALRGRISGTWSRGGLNIMAAVNYAGAYKAPAGRRVDPFATTDLQLGWAPAVGWMRGVTLSVAAFNLFDRPPPFYDNPRGFGYDPANANPVGRSVVVQVAQRW